jgi:hypothetical protein
MYHSLLTYALRQNYLYLRFVHAWKDVSNIWTKILGSNTCTSDWITLSRNKMYHSIMTSAFK